MLGLTEKQIAAAVDLLAAVNLPRILVQVEEMRMEYDAKLAALKATQNDSISAAGTAAAGDVTDKVDRCHVTTCHYSSCLLNHDNTK